MVTGFIFMVLGTFAAVTVAFITAWFRWIPIQVWESDNGVIGLYATSVLCAALLWVCWRLARHLARTIMAHMEKRRIEDLPEFVGGDCPEEQFRNSIEPRLRRCGWQRDPDTGRFSILTV